MTNGSAATGGRRDLLFGDVPLRRWRPPNGDAIAREPWTSFDRARKYLTTGDVERAAVTLREIVERRDLESRQYLEAWHALRDIGERPGSSISRRSCGAVIEVHLAEGLDVLAAYADHTARYLSFSGAVIEWETRIAVMNHYVEDLLSKSERALKAIEPWEGTRPAPPPRGQARIGLLTPGGLRFREGAFEALAKDPFAGPVLAAAIQLMTALIERSEPAV